MTVCHLTTATHEAYVCPVVDVWPCGPTDKASDYGSGDSRFESWQGCFFYHPLPYYMMVHYIQY